MNTKPTLQKTMEVMQAIDEVRLKEQSSLEANQWVNDIHKAYEAQGVAVDRQLIQKVIAEKTAQTYTLYQPSAFQAWVGRVLPHQGLIGKAVAGVTLSLSTVLGVNHTWASYQERKLEKMIDQVAVLNTWANQTDAHWERRHGQVEEKLKPSVDETLESLKLISSVKPSSLEAGEKVLRQGEAVRKHLGAMEQALLDLKAFETWLPKQTWSEGWMEKETNRLLASRSMFMEKGDVLSAQADQNAIKVVAQASASLSSAKQEIASWPKSAQVRGEGMIDAERRAWMALNASLAQKEHQWLQASNTWFKTPFTLRVVNASDQKSGVWRTIEGQNIQNYYLVVQAVTASGQVLDVPVVNEETQKNVVTNIFAVRVPEAQYEKIKQDKMEDGIVDDTLVGQKSANTFDVQYAMDVSGGMITEW